jgi:YesN/AraC family two-component response regulator
MAEQLCFANTELRVCAISTFCANDGIKNSEQEKNQYHYRLLLVQKGDAHLSCMGTRAHLKQNSILLLPPDCPYRITDVENELVLLSLWFSVEKDENDAPYETVLQRDFDPARASARLSFTESDAFDHVFLWLPSSYSAKTILKIAQEFDSQKDAFSPHRASKQLWLFLSDTLRTLQERKEADKEKSLQVEQILSYIRAHLCDKIDCADIALHFDCHPNHLNRLIKQKTGESAKQYLLREKMRFARLLLNESDLSGAQVAQKLGFFDYSHFSKCYKKYSE